MSDYRFAAFHQPIDFDFTFKLLLSPLGLASNKNIMIFTVLY